LASYPSGKAKTTYIFEISRVSAYDTVSVQHYARRRYS